MEELIGKEFDRLTVEETFSIPEGKGKRVWCFCRCRCGKRKSVNSAKLLQRRTKSCGCLKKDHPPPKRIWTLPYGEANRNRVLDNYKSSARRKGFVFTLSNEEAYSLFQSSCFYCGALPTNTMGRESYNGSYVYNGIDRVDNTKGYEKENVVPCCANCNFKKSDENASAFIEWVHRVSDHLRGRNRT